MNDYEQLDRVETREEDEIQDEAMDKKSQRSNDSFHSATSKGSKRKFSKNEVFAADNPYS